MDTSQHNNRRDVVRSPSMWRSALNFMTESLRSSLSHEAAQDQLVSALHAGARRTNKVQSVGHAPAKRSWSFGKPQRHARECERPPPLPSPTPPLSPQPFTEDGYCRDQIQIFQYIPQLSEELYYDF